MSTTTYRPAVFLFPDALVTYHTLPPYMGVYVEILFTRIHGQQRCYPVQAPDKLLYSAVFDARLPRLKRLKTAKN
jgi:hypothetical protein